MKDLEHNATPVTCHFVDVSLIDVSARCLTGGLEPQGFCASRAGMAPRAKVAAED